jgi:hypothetical protein
VIKLKKETILYILSFFAVVIAVTGAISYTGTNENLENFHQVKIEEGDSLWSIAEQFHENANKIHSSVIKPGDLVFVPVEKEQLYQFEQIASE